MERLNREYIEDTYKSKVIQMQTFDVNCRAET